MLLVPGLSQQFVEKVFNRFSFVFVFIKDTFHGVISISRTKQ